MSLHSFPFDALGTECVLHLHAESAATAENTAVAASDEVNRIEMRYSRYREDSMLALINRAAARGDSIDVDAETAALLGYALAAHRMSHGLFDITSGILRRAWHFESGQLPMASDVAALLPYIGMDKLEWNSPRLGFRISGMELDFGGIGKEYAADRAADLCYANGITRGLVDLGGDIRVLGPHPDGSPWRIGIRDPSNPATACTIVTLFTGALATSGDYERYIDDGGRRYCHILDPHTGWPSHGLRSVSVSAETCLLAGSLTTVAMLMGDRGKDWLSGQGVDHLWIDEAGNGGGPLRA